MAAVATASSDPHPVPPPEAPRRSAVLIVLHDGDDGPEVLMTRRSMALRHHRGEISFPGGRVDPGETDVDTAQREAWEEVRLDPRDVTVHGRLAPLSTVVSQSFIVPLVATVERRPQLVAEPAEVDRILWVPVAELLDPTIYREERWGEPPVEHRVHFFELVDETVWGATARMLTQLFSLAIGVQPPGDTRLDGPVGQGPPATRTTR